MNTETGEYYGTPVEIAAAQARGEPLAALGPRAAQIVRLGNQEQRRRDRKAHEKRVRNQAKRSRRANRRR